MKKMKGFTTKIIHSDRLNEVEHGSLHKPIHATVAYGYDDARELAAVFQGKKPGFSYGRQINPTIEALQTKVSKMENGLQTVCFSTGMAAIGTMLFALLKNGDHFISSSFLFGNTNSLFNQFSAHGIDVTFVDATDEKSVEAAINSRTRLVFVETIANPRTQVSALSEIGSICKKNNLVYVVDNTMTTPYLFQPKVVDASLVINSLTKYIGGHGNALGGAVTELGSYDWSKYPNISDDYKKGSTDTWGITQIKKKGLRDFGASLGPEAAHHLSVGAETLALRIERQCANARTITNFLVAHEKISHVYYPGLENHPQFTRASELFEYPGAIFSFELIDEVDIWKFLNELKIIIRSSNLGDNRTLAIPVAHTIYYEMGAERRATMGIKDSLIRISVGIEEEEDLINDLDAALSSA